MSDLPTIKQALERAVKTVALRPERGQRAYSNTATIDSGLLCHVEEADRSLTLDMPKALGGADAGPNPSMILRSAMSGCVAIGVKQFAARRDVPVDRIEVTVETDLDARGQLGVSEDITPGFGRTRLHIVVTSSSPAQVIQDIVEEAVKYSPLVDVFGRPQPLEHRISAIRPGAAAKSEEMA